MPKGLHEGFPLLISPRGFHLPWQRADLDQQDMEAFVRQNELVTLQESGNPADGTESEEEEGGYRGF